MQFNYEGHSLKSGIYKITNNQNQRIYIGSAKEFKSRWQGHARSLRANRHSNQYLQNDFNKCGPDAFQFDVIEVTEGTQEERRDKEQFWIDQHHDKQEQCYNHRKDAFVMTEQSIEELRKNQSQRTKELWQNSEYRSRHEEAIRSSHQTPEFSQKASASAKAKWSHPEFLARVESIYQTDEFKAKVGEHSKVMWADENHRLRQSESRKASWANNSDRKQEASVRMKAGMAKTYTLLSPDGEQVTFTNMQSFCSEKGLHPSGLCKVASGKWPSYKGWTKPI